MKKIVLKPLVITTLILIASLSGCIYSIGWNHADEEGTSITLVGKLSSLLKTENWELGFVYDDEFHFDWTDYQNFTPAEDISLFNSFYATLDGLERNSTIHFRAVGRLKLPISRTIQSIDIELKPGWPSVHTDKPTNINLTNCSLNGELIHLGGASTCNVWFEYGVNEKDLDKNTTKISYDFPSKFDITLEDLTSCNTYYYRAVAENDIGIVKGLMETVTPGGPSVSTRFASDIDFNSAVLNAELTCLGGTDECLVWFEYGSSGDNLNQLTEKITMDSIGEYNIPIENLESYSTYYFRAVADNGICEGKGSVFSFETDPTLIQVLSSR